MSDREKLIELMKYSSCISIYGVVDPDVDIVVNWEDVADHLIANGVVIQKQGEWIEVTNSRGGYECSYCHEYSPSYRSGEDNLSRYCPNCGAKMKEV